MNEISQRLSQKRKAKKLRQHQVAEHLDVSLGAVSQWEQGKTRPNMNHLVSLAKLLDVSLDWLLSGTESTKEPQRASYDAKESKASMPIDHNKGLSTEQQRLLNAFAKLPKDWQNKVLETLQLLAERYGSRR
jgi:transcriptional regulator with XRE-family HTH domain